LFDKMLQNLKDHAPDNLNIYEILMYDSKMEEVSQRQNDIVTSLGMSDFVSTKCLNGISNCMGVTIASILYLVPPTCKKFKIDQLLRFKQAIEDAANDPNAWTNSLWKLC
jgi:hypothetical protein